MYILLSCGSPSMITFGHNVVRHTNVCDQVKIQHLSTDQGETFCQVSVNSIKGVARVSVIKCKSARTVPPSKMAKTKIKNNMHIFISVENSLQNLRSIRNTEEQLRGQDFGWAEDGRGSFL